jgi:hypothetical protein
MARKNHNDPIVFFLPFHLEMRRRRNFCSRADRVHSAAGGEDQDFGRVPKWATTYSFTASANILGAHPPTHTNPLSSKANIFDFSGLISFTRVGPGAHASYLSRALIFKALVLKPLRESEKSRKTDVEEKNPTIRTKNSRVLRKPFALQRWLSSLPNKSHPSVERALW